MPSAYQPVCFMVMPFRKKAVTDGRPGAPQELDCDRLWDAALRPAIVELGYLPVRADLETGTVIVKDMLNRLQHAGLVLADISLPNGNVYYEVGIRHAAREKGCVLIAAEWFKPLFDIDYVRTLVYPLTHGEVPDDEAARIRAFLVAQLPALRDMRSPHHELVSATPESAFEEEARRLGNFQAELSRVRLLPPGGGRRAAIDKLVGSQGSVAGIQPNVAVELVALIRDTSDWAAVQAFVEGLPQKTREIEVVQEQYFLALSKLGQHAQAIAGIEQLVSLHGPTPERLGLIGGRFKQLYRQARAAREEQGQERQTHQERKYLKAAIESYERGLRLDLNEYYCASNLPGLYRARGRQGDERRATATDVLVLQACQRAQELGTGDAWLPNTLFGAAFRGGDLEVLESIVEDIEHGPLWQLQATISDAQDWIERAPDDLREDLEEILERLRDVAAERQTPSQPPEMGKA